MLPFKKILAPTDFSDRSRPAIDAAIELARHFDSELLLVHVLTPVATTGPAVAGHSPIDFEAYRETLVNDARQTLGQMVERHVPGEVACRFEVRWGSPAETIVEMAERERSDVIVICTRGATGLSRFVAGSVTEKVVRLSDVPVLTVQSVDDS
jgi:nucleotide-binding universal stress UspA family protein